MASKKTDGLKNKSQELTQMIGCKVTDAKYKEIVDFCTERDFNMSKFMRYAFDESMEKIKESEK